MKVLVTGGTGFLGRHLCRRWLERSWEVTVVSRDPKKVIRLFGNAVRGVALDQLGQLPKEGKPFDLVVNLAGAPPLRWPWPAHYKRILVESRTDTTRRLVDYLASVEEKPDLLISGSAIGYYGDRGDELLDETSPPPKKADFAHELCAAWEAEARQAETFGIRVCLMRTSLVLARDGGFLARLLPLSKLGLLAKIGSGKQWMSWIHIEDYLNLYDFLIQRKTLSGPINGAAPHPVTNAEFTKVLAHILSRPAFLTLPGWWLRFTAGALADLMLASQRVVPRRLLEAGIQFHFPTLELTLRDLLITP